MGKMLFENDDNANKYNILLSRNVWRAVFLANDLCDSIHPEANFEFEMISTNTFGGSVSPSFRINFYFIIQFFIKN